MAGEAERRRIVMLGAPGSGKGTQAELLAKSCGVPAISTGEMLRQAVAAGSGLGQRVADILNAGALVDDATMADVVRERLAAPDAAGGFLLDGYPRNLGQAATLDGLLAQLGIRLDAVLFLEVPEEELVKRALSRGRADDRAEVIRERLRVYREQTEPLVARYRQQGLLHALDGYRPVEAVTKDLLAVLR